MAAARITGSLCRIARAIALCGALTGCATLNSMLGDDPKEREREKEKEEIVAAQSTASKQTVVHPSPTTIDPDEIADLQLKMTRLVARTEELEEKFSRQQERLQIIERGLTLGIVPEELQGHANDKPRAPSSKGGHSAKPSKSSKSSKSTGPVKSAKVEEIEADEEDDAEASASASAAPDSDPAKAAGVVVADRDEFNKAFAAAHEDFRAGRFGKAIVGFSEIGKKFDPGLTSGVQQFWIARSWASLKEMQTARQLFTEFIAGHPDSPWAPRAKLELARVESALGLKETAIKRLRSVIAEHPLEDVAEMAKAEVERMSKTL